MSKITNTANAPRPDWLFGGDSRSIERQEAAGQQELVNASVLPADCDSASRAALEAAGVVFGEPVAGDPIFVNVTLPDGWKKVATDHSMWSDLVDGDGKKRAGIFYKAAFYDRNARMYVTKD
jgi:hypothetical protein